MLMKNMVLGIITRHLRTSLLILLVGLCIEEAYSQPNNLYQPPVFTDSHRMQKIQAALPAIDSLFHAYAVQHHYPGFAYGLVVDGQLVHSGAFGYTDVDQKTSATNMSLFRIASMTK